jgi:hypothetical protein
MLEVRRATPDEVLAAILAEKDKADPHGRHTPEALAAMLERGACYRVTKDGVNVAFYALEIEGREVWITAAAGRSDADLTAVMNEVVAVQARGFEAIVFKTWRPGLVKKAMALGYECELRKSLK